MASLSTHLRLGRVSNLPTVWSNVLAAAVLAGTYATQPPGNVPVPQQAGIGIVVTLMIAFSLFYVAGMYMNDACDADIDAQERPTRPIPSGHIGQQEVWLWTVVWMLCGGLLLILARQATDIGGRTPLSEHGWWLAAGALILTITLYNRHHKQNPFSPVLMALCRVWVLVSTALLLVSQLPAELLLALAMILVWLVGLTWIAKQESAAEPNRSLGQWWPVACLVTPIVVGVLLSVSRHPLTLLPCILLAVLSWLAVRRVRAGQIGPSIGLMIAGISLVDAIMIGSTGSLWSCVFAVLCCALTLLAQRHISGT